VANFINEKLIIDDIIEELSKYGLNYSGNVFGTVRESISAEVLSSLIRKASALHLKMVKISEPFISQERLLKSHSYIGSVSRPDIVICDTENYTFKVVEFNIDAAIGYIVESSIITEVCNKYNNTNFPIPSKEFSRFLRDIMIKEKKEGILLIEINNAPLQKRKVTNALKISLMNENLPVTVMEPEDILRNKPTSQILIRTSALLSIDDAIVTGLVEIEKKYFVLNGTECLATNNKSLLRTDFNDLEDITLRCLPCDLWKPTYFEDVVLKHVLSNKGKLVFVKKEIDNEEWENHYQKALNDADNWIIQEYAHGNTTQICCNNQVVSGQLLLSLFFFGECETGFLMRGSLGKNRKILHPGDANTVFVVPVLG